MSSKLRSCMWNLWMLWRRSRQSRPEQVGPAVWCTTALWAGPFSLSMLFGGTAPHSALETTLTGKETKRVLTRVLTGSCRHPAAPSYLSLPWRSDEWPDPTQALTPAGVVTGSTPSSFFCNPQTILHKLPRHPRHTVITCALSPSRWNIQN